MSSAGFQGRREELQTLERWLHGVARGVSGTCFVEGEAGIGKSRLAAEAMRLAGEAGFVRVVGEGQELRRTLPFGVITEGLGCTLEAEDPGRAEIARSLTESHDPGVQYRVLEALVELVEEMALRSPLLLVAEDLHWSDPSSLLALHTFGGRLTGLPFALLGTMRPLPRVRELERMTDQEGVLRLRLGPLAQEEVHGLVEDLLGSPPTGDLVEQVAGAAGNPLYVTELVRALEGESAIAVSGRGADVAAASLPPSLRLTLLRRIGFLSENTLATLRLAAVLGASFSPTELASATGRAVSDLLPALEEGREARLLEEHRDEIRFRHELIRSAIYEDLPAPVRAGLHLEVGRALAAGGAPALTVARHISRSAAPGDRDAVGWLRRAAGEAAGASPVVAIELLESAAALLPKDDAERDEVLVELARLSLLAGRAGQAEAIARDVLQRADGARLEEPLRLTLVPALFFQGRWAEEIEETEIALSRLGLSKVARARLLAESALARLWNGDLDGAWTAGQEGARLGEEAGDDLAISLGWQHASGVLGSRGDVRGFLELSQKALAAAQTPEALARHPHIGVAIGHFDVDQFAESAATILEGRRLAEEMGTAWVLPLYHTVLGMGRYQSGDWDDAIAELQAGLSLGREVGSHPVALAAHAILASIAVHRDELTAAREELVAGHAILEASGPQWSIWWFRRSEGQLAEALGEDGLGPMASAWQEFEEAGVRGWQIWMGPELTRMAIARDERELAARVARSLGETASVARTDGAQGVALLARGLVDEDPGALEGAVHSFERAGRVREQAIACEMLGVQLSASGRSADAERLFTEAVAIFERLEARRDLGRVTSAMRSAGIRRGARGERKRPTTGWDSLTPTELDVVGLAAEGLTNPEIGRRLYVSRYTVATHLSHVFAKLGIASRVELAALASKRG